MGVPMQQHISRGQRRQIFHMIDMPVGRINEPLPHRKHRIIGQHGEFQHHLVHLGITVAPHAEQLLLFPVQQGDDLLGSVLSGQVVAGAVVEQVAQQEQPVGSLPLKGLQHFAAVVGRPVQV